MKKNKFGFTELDLKVLTLEIRGITKKIKTGKKKKERADG